MKWLRSLFKSDTKRYPSELHGYLEVTYFRGEKILNTKNANYSSGSFQEILEYGFTKVDLSTVENTLILGLGGGSGIRSLWNTFDYKKEITVVEIEPKIIQIAEEEFGISESPTLKIIEADAFEYVKTTSQTFQLVLVDIFVDADVPELFYGEEFCNNLSKIIDTDGYCIFNLGMGLDKNSEIIRSASANLKNNFDLKLYENVGLANSLLIGKRKKI